MIKYLPGDKVRVTRHARYRFASDTDLWPGRSATLDAGQVVILRIEPNWPPDGWWIAKWNHLDILIDESDFELPNLLETLARAAAESWEL